MKKLIIGLAAVTLLLVGSLAYLSVPRYTSVCVQKCTRGTRYFQNVIETKDIDGNRQVIINHRKRGEPAYEKMRKVGLTCIDKQGNKLPTWNAMDIVCVESYSRSIDLLVDTSYKLNMGKPVSKFLQYLPVKKDFYYIQYDQITFRLDDPPSPEWGPEVMVTWLEGKRLFEAGAYEGAKCKKYILDDKDEVIEYVEF